MKQTTLNPFGEKMNQNTENIETKQEFFQNGQLRYQYHYQNGLRHDPDQNTPACQVWYSNGQLQYQRHYQNGLRHDPDHNTPAVQQWYENGQLDYQVHYKLGFRHAIERPSYFDFGQKSYRFHVLDNEIQPNFENNNIKPIW